MHPEIWCVRLNARFHRQLSYPLLCDTSVSQRGLDITFQDNTEHTATRAIIRPQFTLAYGFRLQYAHKYLI